MLFLSKFYLAISNLEEAKRTLRVMIFMGCGGSSPPSPSNVEKKRRQRRKKGRKKRERKKKSHLSSSVGFVLSQAQRFKKVSGPIMKAWLVPKSLPKVDFIWYWSEISCSMITNSVVSRWPANGVNLKRLEDTGVGTYDLATETVDLVQLAFGCLKKNKDNNNKSTLE